MRSNVRQRQIWDEGMHISGNICFLCAMGALCVGCIMCSVHCMDWEAATPESGRDPDATLPSVRCDINC